MIKTAEKLVLHNLLHAGPEINFFGHRPLWQVDLKIHLPQRLFTSHFFFCLIFCLSEKMVGKNNNIVKFLFFSPLFHNTFTCKNTTFKCCQVGLIITLRTYFFKIFLFIDFDTHTTSI